MPSIQVQKTEFEKIVAQADKTVLVEFYAPWCTHCKAMTPIIDEVSEALGGKAIVTKVNIDENSDLGEKYKIMSVPTIMVFKNGKKTETLVGAQTKERLLSAVAD